MPGQNLTTNIIINAKTGNGFGKVGATLTEMGMIVNGISQQLIDFGEDSVKVYREYELSMRDAEVALSTTYGRGTQQLQNVMNQLDTAATNWAATTIFHTNDVSNAISEAAHAGWDFDRIMSGIPEAMELAQAGSMDLSDALNYIVKSTYAAGVEFDDLNHFTDIWAYSANKSATTIGEIGDVMLRMGSTMRFAANPEELMTLIAVMANSGYVGSEAGTLIRNSMLRLIAPTDKANKALAAMGATAEEIAEVAGDEQITAAYESLIEHGFHGLYDESGQMRSVLDVYSEMAVILGEMAGGIENITDNKEAMNILGTIFPTRTITGALNLMNAAANNYDGLYEKLMSGEAEGYGEYAAETMMDTLNGSIMIFESKGERLKQLVGEELNPLVQNMAEFGGNMIDSIAEMDPGAFSALVDGLTVVAGVGPALLTAGAAFRLIGLAMTPVGGAALGLTALAAAAVAMKDLSDSRFAEQFGSMELDAAALTGYIGSLGDGFREAYSEVDNFTASMNDAVASYQTASSTFSGTLLTDMLTHAQLTDADKAKLTQLGNDMYSAVQEAIANSTAASKSYWQTLFGGDGRADYDPAYQQILALTNQAYEDAMGQAEEISQGMRDALTSAFADGQISEEEYQQILAYMRSYNDALARAASEAKNEEDFIQRQKWLHQAQTASWDEIQEISGAAQAERDSYLAEREDQYLTERFRLQYRGADEATLAAADARHRQEMADIYASYDQFFMDLYGSQRGQNELTPDANGRVLATQYNAMGGQEGIEQAAEAYANAGNAEAVAQLEQFQAEFSNAGITRTSRYWWDFLNIFGDYSTESRDMAFADAVGAAQMGSSYIPIAQQKAQIEGWQRFFNTQAEMAASNPYMYMDPTAAAGMQVGQGLSDLIFSPKADLSAISGGIEEIEGQSLTMDVGGDLSALDAEIAARDGTSITVGVVPAGGGASSGARGGFNGLFNRLFSSGGRATEPSIFGEGELPEWAIPEEHSERTAALLNAARAASGFTWPDLLARFGGLNASPNNSPSTFIYSPVIHANNASGVAEALKEDKQRLEKWWKEQKMRDAMEVYT